MSTKNSTELVNKVANVLENCDGTSKEAAEAVLQFMAKEFDRHLEEVFEKLEGEL